jgi:hypothetical protein
MKSFIGTADELSKIQMRYLIITDHPSYEDVNIMPNLEEMPLLIKKIQIVNDTIVIHVFYVEETPLLNLRKPKQIRLTIMSDGQEMPVPNSKSLSH